MKKTIQRWAPIKSIILAGVVFMCAFSVAVPALAATLSQTFLTEGEVSAGNIVSLNKSAKTVIKANKDNLVNLYGVAVSSSDVNFSQEGSKGSEIATSGVINTFVSTLNGPINSGDPITVSTIEGIGEKAILNGKIIGVAQGSVSDTSEGAKDFELKEGETSRTVKVVSIPVKIEVSNYNPAIGLTNGQATDVSDRNKVLQVADSIAGKPVKALSLIVAAIVMLIGIFVSTFLITSSGYASMISIGRNPLSEKKIMKSLIRLMVVSIGIFLVGVTLAYVILKLF